MRAHSDSPEGPSKPLGVDIGLVPPTILLWLFLPFFVHGRFDQRRPNFRRHFRSKWILVGCNCDSGSTVRDLEPGLRGRVLPVDTEGGESPEGYVGVGGYINGGSRTDPELSLSHVDLLAAESSTK